MKAKTNKRKYFVGTKKLKHVKMFENFDNDGEECDPEDMAIDVENKDADDLHEGKMKEIMILAKEAENFEAFLESVVKLANMKEEDITEEFKTDMKQKFEDARK